MLPTYAEKSTKLCLASTIEGKVGSMGTPKAKLIQLGFFFSISINLKENPLTGLKPTNSLTETEN